VRFVDELEGSKLSSVIKYKNYKGEDQEQELWKTLLHWFNHQTHHRGQVSVLLDIGRAVGARLFVSADSDMIEPRPHSWFQLSKIS